MSAAGRWSSRRPSCCSARSRPAAARPPSRCRPRPRRRAPADAAACGRHAETAQLLRREADTYAAMPVPAVRVALVLVATWEFYDDPGAQDSDLRAAMSEVAAAIGDLDAQGQAGVPAGGTLMDPVQLDPTRARAAVDAVDRECAG